MTDYEAIVHAKRTIRISRWTLLAAVIFGLITCFFGFSRFPYLLACAAAGIVWFALIVLSWRRRSDWLRLLSLMFVIFSQQMAWHWFAGDRQFVEILVVFSVLTVLLRRWVYKFVGLHEHVA
jgi:hypothetical protein